MGMMRKMALMKAMAGPMESEEDMPQEAYETSEATETYSKPGDGAKREMRKANKRRMKLKKAGMCYSGDKCFKRN